MDKSDILAAIKAELEKQLSLLERSASDARESATSEESRAENEYDTRGLEASYLAGAQAARAEQLRAELSQLKQVPARAWKKGEAIGAGALCELEDDDGKKATYFVSTGRGMNLKVGGKALTVVTPAAPLGRELLGKHAGDDVEVEVRGEAKGYSVLKVS